MLFHKMNGYYTLNFKKLNDNFLKYVIVPMNSKGTTFEVGVFYSILNHSKTF